MTETEPDNTRELSIEWPLPGSALLGSAVRLKGIAQEMRSRLPFAGRSGLRGEAGRLVLTMPKGEGPLFDKAAAIVSKALGGIDGLPVLPREVEDILAIVPRERLKWTKDGRLKSAGTKTVKLRGRAKAVTFHVFDPRHVEDLLDRDMPALWREEDARATAENRRRAAGKAALTRAQGKAPAEDATGPRAARRPEAARADLKEWDAFAADGLLR
ncbi:MAG: hypothetical protein INR68_04830 [Methylobacterium mesophilicum]|nr:hypothetical protein [Methylobacterium mesophilicum]